jgi:hypothetical protein
MRIGYLTLDEVNETLGRELGLRFHIEFEKLSFCDDGAVECCDALLCEVDYLVPGDRQRLFTWLIDRSANRPVAVHGFHLCRRETRDLRAAGILVFRQLQPRVFRRLIGAVREHADLGVHLLSGSH